LKHRRAKKSAEADVEVGPGGFQGAMLNVKNDLAFLKKVRGGRLRALKWTIVSKQDQPESPRGSPSTSPMKSAVGMPGLLAASISGVPEVERRASATGQTQENDVTSGQEGRNEATR
jgi:Ca2+-transporting ATPase